MWRPGNSDGVAGCLGSSRACSHARSLSPAKHNLTPEISGQAEKNASLVAASKRQSQTVSADCLEASGAQTARADKPNTFASPRQQSEDDHDPGWRQTLGGSKQRLSSPGSSGDLAACLSAWVVKVPLGKRAQSPTSLRRSGSCGELPAKRSGSPAPQERPAFLNSSHILHSHDNVPLWMNQTTSLKQRNAIPHRPEEELDIDAFRVVRCFDGDKGKKLQSSLPFARDVQKEQIDASNKFLVGKQGLVLGSVRRARSGSPPHLEPSSWGPADDSEPGPVHLLGPTGPKDAVFHAFAPTRHKRHVATPGDCPAENARVTSTVSELVSDDNDSLRMHAAGVVSPCYERGHGVFPRSADDAVFLRAKFGSRRYGFGSQSSTCCATPTSSSRDLANGLNPEPSQLCAESFLGDRRRRSPRASPSTSPWGSPRNSPRWTSPPGTPPNGCGAASFIPPVDASSRPHLPSWSAMASAAGEIAEGVESPRVPTWTERSSPRVSKESRAAAVTILRSGSGVSLGTPVAVTDNFEVKYRGREVNVRKAHESVKSRWRM